MVKGQRVAGAILVWVVSEGLSVELTFEQRPEGDATKACGGTQCRQKGQQVHSPRGDVFAMFEGQQGGQGG